MDSNGYNASILETESGLCYLCGLHTDTVRHEVFFGTANRKLSKQYGLWLNLCPCCHRRVHADRELDLELKMYAQVRFEKRHSRDEFMRIIGRNYAE